MKKILMTSCTIILLIGVAVLLIKKKQRISIAVDYYDQYEGDEYYVGN